MKQMVYRIEGVHTAKGRITQSGTQKAGAHSLLPLKDVWFEGDMTSVPYISANSVRGKLRRLIMEDMCVQLGYQFSDDRVWHAFFGGGQLKGGGDGMIDAQWRQEIIQKLPPVALWGFSLGNQMIEGKLIVYDLDVCAEELKLSIPAKYHDLCRESVYQFMSNVFFTRKDDKQSGKVKDEDDPAIQMKVEVQCLIPGTKLYHGFAIRHYPSELEISCLHRAIKLWDEIPMIGGKTSGGYGELALGYEGDIDDGPYLQYLEKNRAALISYLHTLTAAAAAKLEKMSNKKTKATKKTVKPAAPEETEETHDGDDMRENPAKTQSSAQTRLPL